jgi:hypothetical protein
MTPQPNISPQAVERLDVQFWIKAPDEAANWSEIGDVFYDDDDSWWIRAHHATRYTKHFVENCIAQEDSSFCSFQGGFMIWTDGTLWNDYAVDDVYMAMHWFQGLEHLLSKHKGEMEIWVWEMSKLVLRRDDTALTMYETEWRQAGFCPPVIVDFYDFTRRMVAEGLEFAKWIRAMHREIASLRSIEDLQYLNEARRSAAAARSALPESAKPVLTTEEKLGMIIEQLPLSFVETIERVSRISPLPDTRG